MDQVRVIDVILAAIKELNQQADEDHKLDISPETRLLGQSSKLDSLGLVNLIVLVEENITDNFGKSITLADERAMLQERSPFRTVRSLSNYVTDLLNEKENA